MTLSERNVVFKTGIAFSFICLVLCIAASVKAIPVYPSLASEISRRGEGILHTLAGKFLDVNLLAVHCCILVLVLYSFFSIVFIYYFFEKTQSPEILFIALFTVSFSLETLRLILPLGLVYEIPSLYFVVASRLILFGRYFGIFSLFAASIYAVGFEMQQQRYAVMFITVTTMLIALGVPVDTQTWDTDFCMVNGYVPMLRLIEAGTFLITTVSFFVAAWSRSCREFVFIGAGSALAFLGRNILLNADTWAGPPAGLLFLAAGTWLICINLHKIYLWL